MMCFKTVLTFTFLCFYSATALAQKPCGLNLKKEELKNYRYILIPGVLNEIITHYMTEHRRFLMYNGVPTSQIHRINLSSFDKPGLAVDTLEEAFKKIPSDKELIFIAHSKGALETLYFLKKHYSQLKLKKAVFIQGPLDGSSMTKLPGEEAFSGVVKFLIAKLESVEYIKDYNRSYGYKRVRSNLSNLYDYPDLIKKSLFIESDTVYKKLKWKFKALGSQYFEYFGSVGDGVLMGSDHIPYVLKNDKALCRWKYDEDHSNLVKAAPWNRAKVKKIRKFMRRLLL
jgi:triacylglycerol esterase/lipase EstA (alpha/beta hydrolase family)